MEPTTDKVHKTLALQKNQVSVKRVCDFYVTWAGPTCMQTNGTVHYHTKEDGANGQFYSRLINRGLSQSSHCHCRHIGQSLYQ